MIKEAFPFMCDTLPSPVCFVSILKLLNSSVIELTDDILLYSEEISRDEQRRIIWIAVSSVAGFLGLFIFLIFQDVLQTMVFTDFWTLIHAVLLGAEIFAVILAFKKSKRAVSSITEIENNAQIV